MYHIIDKHFFFHLVN